jgi:hypothetical protein
LLPTEDEWKGFTELFNKAFPGGLPRTFSASKDRKLGGIRNFFKHLPETAQNALVDDEFLSLLEYML